MIQYAETTVLSAEIMAGRDGIMKRYAERMKRYAWLVTLGRDGFPAYLSISFGFFIIFMSKNSFLQTLKSNTYELL